jgi:hypothetical protein
MYTSVLNIIDLILILAICRVTCRYIYKWQGVVLQSHWSNPSEPQKALHNSKSWIYVTSFPQNVHTFGIVSTRWPVVCDLWAVDDSTLISSGKTIWNILLLMSTLTYVGWMSTSRREVSKYLQCHTLAFDENMSVLTLPWWCTWGFWPFWMWCCDRGWMAHCFDGMHFLIVFIHKGQVEEAEWLLVHLTHENKASMFL